MRHGEADRPVLGRHDAQLLEGDGGASGERVPVALSRRPERRERRLVVPERCGGMCLDELNERAHRCAYATGLGHQVVLEPARHPDVNRLLVYDELERQFPTRFAVQVKR
jgi:hypothetical protein